MSYLKKAHREILQNIFEIIAAREQTLTEEEQQQFETFKSFLSESDEKNEKLIALAIDRTTEFRSNPKNKKKMKQYNRTNYLNRKARKDQGTA